MTARPWQVLEFSRCGASQRLSVHGTYATEAAAFAVLASRIIHHNWYALSEWHINRWATSLVFAVRHRPSGQTIGPEIHRRFFPVDRPSLYAAATGLDPKVFEAAARLDEAAGAVPDGAHGVQVLVEAALSAWPAPIAVQVAFLTHQFRNTNAGKSGTKGA